MATVVTQSLRERYRSKPEIFGLLGGDNTPKDEINGPRIHSQADDLRPVDTATIYLKIAQLNFSAVGSVLPHLAAGITACP